MWFSKKYKIVIADPCHEDWKKMTPAGKGRFCDSCSKNVTDYSVLTEFQITEMLRNNNGKLCGRFRKEQLDKIYTLQPRIRLSAQKRFFQYIMSLFMGSVAFFDKASGQSTFTQASVDKTDTLKAEPVDSLKMITQADSALADTANILSDTISAEDKGYTWTAVDPEIPEDPTIFVIEQIYISGCISSPPVQIDEFPFIPAIFDSIKSLVGIEPVKKRITLIENTIQEKEKPREPIKKEEPVSAVLPEEIKRKTEENLNT